MPQKFLSQETTFSGYFVLKECTLFQKIWSWTRYKRPKFVRYIEVVLDARHRFCIWKVASKKQILQVFLPLKEPFVALLNETCALTSAANVAKKGMNIPNLSKTIRLFCPKLKRRSVTKRISIFLINLKSLYLVQPYTFWEWQHDFYQS